ncbi:MAG: hypothetical protein LBD32_00460 [Cytophagales bacterium]|jgi:hypothetical protein|nr:hypothetical protein [Cytophagales bacterium]
MKYNKNIYFQILKSFRILSSSVAVCACGNNNLSSQHDEEKITVEEIVNCIEKKFSVLIK